MRDWIVKAAVVWIGAAALVALAVARVEGWRSHRVGTPETLGATLLAAAPQEWKHADRRELALRLDTELLARGFNVYVVRVHGQPDAGGDARLWIMMFPSTRHRAQELVAQLDLGSLREAGFSEVQVLTRGETDDFEEWVWPLIESVRRGYTLGPVTRKTLDDDPDFFRTER